MTARVTLATALRVLRQLRHDPRTLVLLLVVPVALLVLLRFLLDATPAAFARVGAPLCGLFPFVAMFLVTSVAMLRERVSGTLERLMASPLAKLDLLCGYGLAFGAVAAVQASLACAVGFGALGLRAPHGGAVVALLAVANATLGMALGLLASAFARSEFQAVQFMPAVVFPQLLLCGLFAPRDGMAQALRSASDLLPLTYAYDALSRAASPGTLGGAMAADVAVVVGATLLALVLASLTLRRRTP